MSGRKGKNDGREGRGSSKRFRRESPGERFARAFEEGERGFQRRERESGQRRENESGQRRENESASRAGERAGARPGRLAGGASEARAPETGDHLFGVQPVLEALRAGARPIERITVAEGAHESRLREIFELARRENVPIRRAPRVELQRLSSGANHQGVAATVAAARYADAEELLDQLSARVGSDDPPLAVVLDGVEDPRNLGAIIRTVECVGAHGVFVPERRAAGLTETTAKAAAGALEYVKVARAVNIARLVEELKERGIWTVGASADAEMSYTEWDWTGPCALVLGGEGDGVRRLVRERCDALVSVPQRGRIESLNVSVAAGVMLFEALRQRTSGRERA